MHAWVYEICISGIKHCSELFLNLKYILENSFVAQQQKLSTTVGLAAVTSHPLLYFKPSDRGPLPLDWTPLSLCGPKHGPLLAQDIYTHLHKAAPASWCKGNGRGNLPDGAASLNHCLGFIKFAFLQEGWHVCQSTHTHSHSHIHHSEQFAFYFQPLILTWCRLNTDWISVDILLCLNA